MSTISFSGLASGMDTESIIQQLVALKKIPIRQLENRKSKLQAKNRLIDQLSTTLNSLRDSAKDIDTIEEFLAFTASSSNESAVSAEITTVAQQSSFQVTVNSLAKATKVYSDPQADKDAAGVFGSGTLDIYVGGNLAGSVTVDASTTMETLVQDINDLGIDAKASIFYDGSQYRLMILGTKTGVDNDVTFVENGTSIGVQSPSYREDAQDAEIVVDGSFTVTSSNNEFTGVVPGLKLTVGEVTSSPVTISVNPDADTTIDKVQDFVNHYNSVASFLNNQLSYQGYVKGEDTLFGDFTATSIQRQLAGLITSQISGLPPEMSALSMVGVKTNKDGTLTLDTAKLREKLAEDPEGVANIFIESQSGTQGVAYKMEDLIAGFVDGPNGTLVTKKDSINNTIDNIDDTIDRMERQVDDYESLLRKQFEAMERAISELQGQSFYLASLPQKISK